MPRIAVIITPIATLLPGQKMNELLKTLGLAPLFLLFLFI